MVKNFVAAWGNFRCWIGVCKRVEADDTGFVVALHRVARCQVHEGEKNRLRGGVACVDGSLVS